jgi:hypothetical protein
MKAMLKGMRAERDAWREQAQRLALAAPTPPPPPEAPMVALAAFDGVSGSAIPLNTFFRLRRRP